jgi:hypothetical protein
LRQSAIYSEYCQAGDGNKKNEKIRMLREEKEKKEVEGCFFAPTIYTKRDKEPRKFKDFI